MSPETTLLLLKIVAYIVIAIFGLIVGSFSNMLIYRLPREIKFTKGYSKCTSCEHRLYPKDLIPFFSYIFLRGRCRYCKEKISPRYLIVEILNAGLYVTSAVVFGITLKALLYSIIFSCLVIIIFVDFEHRIIPDSMNLIIFLCGIGLIFAPSSANDLTIIERVIGGLIVSVPFLLIALFSKGRAMGGGDIKMMAALGFCIGWQQTLFTLVLGALLGTLAFLILRRTPLSMGREVPFGTFLAMAGIISALVGSIFIPWYLSLLVHEHHHDHTIHLE